MRFIYAVVSLFLLVVPCVRGQTPASTESATSGTISGRVVSDSGQPLAYVTITLRPVNAVQRVTGTLTDREGKFEIAGLEPRLYQLSAWLSAYTPFYSSTNYRVGDSVTVVLTKGGVITGSVTTDTGDPVVGVRVHARTIDADNQSNPYSYFTPDRVTDDRGVYRLYGLRTGTYVVWAGGDGGRDGGSGMDPFDDLTPTYSPSSTRDTAAGINVHAGEEVSNVDIRFRNEPGHVISGRVIQSNSAQRSHVTLDLTATDKNKAERTTMTDPMDESRSFVFRGVDDGEYELTAMFFGADGNGGALKRIKVEGADVTGIELIPEQLASVTGRIVLEESNKTECTGKQRPVVTETLVSASPDESLPSNYPYSFLLKAPAGIDASGNLSLKTMLPGRYFFVPEFAAKYWYLQSITLPPTTKAARTPALVDATRTWTTLKPGDRLSGLTITLAQGAASVAAELANNNSGDLLLYLVPAEKEQAEEVLRYFVAAIGADGKVALSSIPPGRYWILVRSNMEGAPVSIPKLRMPDQKELRTTLRREAEAAKTAIDLKPCQHLTGFSLKPNQ